MFNRRAQIAQNIRARRRPASGGTTAPASASRGPTTGLAGNQVAPNPGRLGQSQPVQGLSASPQPGAPSPVQAQPAPMPWDVTAANDEASAVKRRNDTMTGLDAGWLRTQQSFGLEGPWADAASNPYSRAALLQRSYDNAKRGTLNTAGQQLYAGSYVNAQNANTHGFNLGRDELQKGYAEENARYISSRQQTENEYQEALAQAAWSRVNAGLESEPEPMPASGPPGGPPSRPKAKKPPNRKEAIKQNISPARKAR